MEWEVLSPISREGGELLLQPGSSALNDDWLRAYRLQQEGDEDSQQELEEMENTAMVRIVDNIDS